MFRLTLLMPKLPEYSDKKATEADTYLLILENIKNGTHRPINCYRGSDKEFPIILDLIASFNSIALDRPAPGRWKFGIPTEEELIPKGPEDMFLMSVISITSVRQYKLPFLVYNCNDEFFQDFRTWIIEKDLFYIQVVIPSL